MLRSISKQSAESVESVRKKKRKVKKRCEGFAEKESFKPGMTDDESVESIGPMDEVPLKELGESGLDRLERG